MNIQKVPIGKLNPAKYNPRKDLTPDDPEYQKLQKSILEFGTVDPLVWNKKTGNLVHGHQRLKILKSLGETELDVSVVNLSLTKEKALNLALNKIQGDWDIGKLRDVLEELDTGAFDMGITGFDPEEIEKLLVDGTPFNMDELLSDLDFSEAIEKPVWAVIRTDIKNIEILDQALAQLEKAGIKVERSYET